MAVPLAPINPQATAGAVLSPVWLPAGTATASGAFMTGMARVSWQPGDIEDTSVTSYAVTSSPGNVSVTVTTPAGALRPPLQAIFPSLTLGTGYTFTIVANNTSGSSPASVASNEVTPAGLPGQLPNVFNTICATLAGDMTAAGVGNPPEFQFGLNFLAERSYAPRIVFVPAAGTGNTWRGVGSSQLGDGVLTPNQLGERRQILEAWIWGLEQPTTDAIQDDLANYGVAEQLANYLIASMKHAFSAGELPQWFSFPKTDGALLAAGCALALRFELKLPMPDYAPSSAALTSVPATINFSGGSGS